ncbi:MAG: hypothetical protein HYV63_30540 [Candidatus Schekmanbacteria bacterium]|nr:hypothetical protein [Candidatus Schekmanbacteria bacterium]
MKASSRIWLATMAIAALVAQSAWAGAPGGPANLRVNRRAVPRDVQRRAAQLLEDVRGTEGAPGWETAQLGEEVYAFYRPDVRGVAYYEFAVAPAGFIVVATGAHDYPIPHWSFTGKSIASQLLQGAVAKGKTASRLYKLDALSYAAETADGGLASQLGNLPMRLEGLHASMIGKVRSADSDAAEAAGGEVEAARRGRLSRYSDLRTADLEIAPWASFSEMKANYSRSFGVLAESLRQEAAASWRSEKAEREHGRALRPGQDNVVALLGAHPTVSTYGAGAAKVSVAARERRGLPPVLVVRPAADSARATTFGVTVSYRGGSSENITFFVPDRNFAAASSWGPWTYYWAGSSGHQRDYYQFTVDGCASGCGATAWAMLFGWADHQANLGNSYWAARWGLYRSGGGYGADADAPASQDAGIRAITLEIRDYIGTFCASGQGATTPWDMSDADQYLSGRTGATLDTHYNSVGISESRLREYARNAIRDRGTPAIIGTGWLEHYPLAWGYGWQSQETWTGTEYNRWFYVNNGWSGTSGDGWVSASTWYAGEIYP